MILTSSYCVPFPQATCAKEIPTPAFNRILEAQDLDKGPDGEDVVLWVYALIGRMLYPVGKLDDWQLSPFFKGVAGTGKSTILRVIRMFYDDEDVGIMSNNIEGKFGLAALYKKLVVLCFELRSDFGLDQAELQQLMSGEPMSIPVKFRTAIPNVQWSAPLAAAGNMTADWSDGQGAMSRRWAVIEFGKPVSKGDPRLMAEIRKELPLLVSVLGFISYWFCFST